MAVEMNALRSKAIDLAASQILSNESPLSAYLDLLAYMTHCSDQGRAGVWAEIDRVLPWQPYETARPEEVLDLIEARADIVENAFRDVLNLAKQGIVEETIAGRLDSDMNTLDMANLAERGALAEAAGTQASEPPRPRF